MQPPEPPEVGELSPEPDPGEPLAECFKAIEQGLEADPASDQGAQDPSA